MIIGNKTYQEIISIQNNMPPETGGILGGTDGCVTTIAYDCGKIGTKKCSYTPDVDMLNQTINEWQDRGIDFMGIFHSHFFGVKTLSEGDKRYILHIMRNMPKSVSFLYFPLIVMPERVMVVFKAEFVKDHLVIVKDGIIWR